MICGSWFFHLCVLGIKLRPSGLAAKCFYLPSHLTSSPVLFVSRLCLQPTGSPNVFPWTSSESILWESVTTVVPGPLPYPAIGLSIPLGDSKASSNAPAAALAWVSFSGFTPQMACGQRAWYIVDAQ